MSAIRITRLYPSSVWIILVVIVVWTAGVLTLRGLSLFDINIYRYGIQPIFVAILAGVIWWLSRGKYSRLRRQREKALFLMSISLLWVIGYFLTGLAVTFVQNPLMANPKSMMLNTALYSMVGISLEYIRYRLILMTGRRHPLVAGGIIAAVLLVFQATTLTIYLPDTLSFIQVLGAVILPLLVYHAVQTYLAYTAGFWSMVVFAVTWLVLYTFLPIMPKYDWYMVGMSALVLGTMVILLLDRTRQDARRPIRMGRRQHNKLMNALFLGCMVALILFMTGVLSYRPTVIMSDSMRPLYGRGDMVIVRQKTPSVSIQVGDIIQYSYKDRLITHRVVELTNSENVVQYITRGDNNDTNDPWLVSEAQISGIVRARLPFAGWPTVILNEMLQGK